MTGISVIVFVSSGGKQLRRCLDALAHQTAPLDSYEVVVIPDSEGGDGRDVLAGYEAPFRIHVEQLTDRGPAGASNRVVRGAGTYCLFLRSDVLADPQLIDEHLRAQQSHGGVLGVGALRLRVRRARGGLARYFAAYWTADCRRLAEGERSPTFPPPYSQILSAPTSAILSIGGFDELLGPTADSELAYRLERSGLRTVHFTNAGGELIYDKSFGGVVRDFDRAGAAAARLFRRHPEVAQYPPLGDFSQGWIVSILLRRLLLALGAPVWPLALLDPLLAVKPAPRLHKFLRLYCFWRGVKRTLDDRDTWLRLTRGTVILMYHALGDASEPASRFVIPAARFRRQVAWLRLVRYPVLTLDQYIGYRETNRLPPARSVVITFDDGYADVAERALPILGGRDVSATVFVVTGSLGTANQWDEGGSLAGRPLMSWEQVRQLRDAGMAIGAHTVSHPSLTGIDRSAAEREVQASRDRLVAELGSPVLHFAYPHGKTSPEVRDVVRALGFASACGVRAGVNGPAVPIHELRRIEVWGTGSLLRFCIELWLGRPLPARRSISAGN